MKALVEITDERLEVLGKKRISTIEDGHCLMWAWAKGWSSSRFMLKAYLEEKIYREDDMDISPNALANASRCKVILYQYRNQSVTLDASSPGRVENEKELELRKFLRKFQLVI